MMAVILCAGQGTRLRPLTDDRPKGMVAVAGRTILERQVEQYRRLGIDDIVVVGGYKHEMIPADAVTKRVNADFDGTNMLYSLFAAEDRFSQADCVVVSYADILYSDGVLRALLEAADPIDVVVDLDWYEYYQRRSDDVLSDAETLLLGNGIITEIGGRPSSLSQIEGQYIGLMKFGAPGIRSLQNIYHAALKDGSEIGWGRPARTAFMTDLLQECVRRGVAVTPVPIRGGWCEIDTLADLALAEAILPTIDR